MAVAARLNVNIRSRRLRKVRSRDRGGAAEEREWRLHHAPIADRHELLQAVRIALAQDVDGILSVVFRFPHCVGLSLDRIA
jgi:hypothetical protein